MPRARSRSIAAGGELEFQGLRVSPAVYNTPEEIDRFSAAMERVAREGLPA